MSSLSDRIGLLRQRATDIAAQLIALGDRRKSYALAAAERDERARKQVADADLEAEALRREEQTLHSAIETAEALARQEQLEAERLREHAKQVELRQHADAIAALNIEIDDRLKALSDCFARRRSQLAALVNLDPGLSTLVMRTAHKSLASAAAAHFKLNSFLALEMTPVINQKPLSDSNPALAGIGTKPEPDKIERVKLKKATP